MNCFQHISGSCGALHSPFGGAPQQRGPLTPQHALSASHPHPLTQAPCTPALAHASSLDTDCTRNARAPTSTRSTGFCAIWACIGSSSSSNRRGNDTPPRVPSINLELHMSEGVTLQKDQSEISQITETNQRRPNTPPFIIPFKVRLLN